MSNSPAGVGFRTIDDPDVSGKTVLVRAALNVPVQGGQVIDITGAVPEWLESKSLPGVAALRKQ